MKRFGLVYMFLAAAMLVAAAGFFADIKNTARYGGVDLRNRVTAARVASELRQNPYFYKWTAGENDRYLDPADNITIPVARVTVPPTVLLFHNLISALPYKTERRIWFVFQWAALIATLALLSTYAPRNRLLVWSAGLFFVAGSQFFRLHVERGQIYIWYVLLFSAAMYAYRQSEKNGRVFPFAVGGLILGYLISLRSPFVFALIPFMLYKRFKFLSFVGIGLLASVLLTGVFFPFALWKSYYQSASFQGAMRALPDINYQSPGVDVAEGINLVQFLNVPGEDSSLQRIVHAFTDIWLNGGALAILLALTIVILALLLRASNIKRQTSDDLFFAAITLVMLAELFIPAPRWPYADVIWLIPLALLMKKLGAAPRGVLRSAVLGLALAGLFFNTGVHGIAKLTLLGEGLFIASLFLALVLPRVEFVPVRTNMPQA